MPTTILLAEDHAMVRDGLRSLLKSQPELKVIGDAANGRLAVQLAAKLRPDLVVMDVAMPELNGIDATRQIISHSPRVKVVALSGLGDKQTVTNMLAAGASGFIMKVNALEELTTAIRKVMAGGVYICPQAARVVVKTIAQKQLRGRQRLSGREREVLQLLAEGRAAKEIADQLELSVKTIETHRRQIMQKLELFSVAELTKYAILEGITSLDVSSRR